MRYDTTPWFILAMIAGLSLAHTGRADEAFKLEEGYVFLFNGKDLTGWGLGKTDLEGKQATDNKRFAVSDGIIVIDGKGGGNLYTIKEFSKDFHLKLEFRAAPRADSGLFIRGPQLQVRDYPTAGPYKKLKNFKDVDWNLLEITVTGTAALCTCNGEVLEKAFKIPAQGSIGLQSETGKFEFRRIRIKEKAE